MHKLLPKISVVIPVLNSVSTMEKALLSVIEQNYPNTEIIVLDAGSTDGTVDVIKRYESHIAYWHSKPDKSSGLAINMGLEKATGVLTAQLMADDWFEPGTFLAIGQAFIEHPDADIVSCGGRVVSWDEKTGAYKTLLSYTTEKELEMSLYSMCFAIPGMSSRFITKALYDKVGLLEPFDAKGKHNFSADREILVRMALFGCKNVVIQHLGHTYFSHQKSATFGKNRANQLKIYQEHMSLVESYFKKFKITADQRAVLLKWYNDQSVRLFIFKMMALDISALATIMKEGVALTKLNWLLSLIVTPCKIAFKKSGMKA